MSRFTEAKSVFHHEEGQVLMLTVCLYFRNFPGIFGNQQQHYMEVIKRMLVQCMQDQANLQVSSGSGS